VADVHREEGVGEEIVEFERIADGDGGDVVEFEGRLGGGGWHVIPRCGCAFRLSGVAKFGQPLIVHRKKAAPAFLTDKVFLLLFVHKKKSLFFF